MVPGEHHDDEPTERHGRAEGVHKYAEDKARCPRRPEDEDLQDGGKALDDTRQDSSNRDEELHERGQGGDGHEEASYDVELSHQPVPDAVNLVHGGTMSMAGCWPWL